MKIVTTRGLDLSLQGAPKEVGFYQKIDPTFVAVDLSAYYPLSLSLKVSPGDIVQPGTPVAEYKNFPGIFITSSSQGIVREIRRGEKRIPLDIVIEKTSGQNPPTRSYDLSSLSESELLNIFKTEGLFALFKQRPFDIPALPTSHPRDIFINLADNRPFIPSAKKLLNIFSSKEEGLYNFVVGVRAIAKAFNLRPHIVTTDRLVIPVRDLSSVAHIHTISGPYPSGSPSTHIHHIAPIRNQKDVVYTITFQEVLTIGHLFLKGKVLNEQIVALSGSALQRKQRRYVITSKGADIYSLLHINKEDVKKASFLITSGDPLTGKRCFEDLPCLGLRDYAVSVLPIPQERELFSFLRLGINKPTLTRTYLSSFSKQKRAYLQVSATLHGENRPIIDTEIYDKVMAIDIPVVPLIKSVIVKDFDKACQLGFLEVSSEDFALPTFIDPSKTEMLKIMKQALIDYAKELGLFSSEHL